MKLYWTSITFAVIHELLLYGNLPYSALRLLPFPYESTKDAVQKLIRAGYVGVVKAKHLKGLYATAAGTKAAEKTYMRNGYEFFGRHPVVYHASKLERIHRLNETELFLHKQILVTLHFRTAETSNASLNKSRAPQIS